MSGAEHSYNVRFEREEIMDIIEDMIKISGGYRDESVPTGNEVYGDFKLNVNRDYYAGASKAGILRTFTARCTASGAIVGFVVYIVSPDPHFSDRLSALQNLMYLEKEYRRGWAGKKMIEYCEKELEKEGVDMVAQFTSVKKDLTKLLEYMGYTLVQYVYSKRLKAVA